MARSDLLKQVAEALEEARIDYVVTGSLASSLQGELRATAWEPLMTTAFR